LIICYNEKDLKLQTTNTKYTRQDIRHWRAAKTQMRRNYSHRPTGGCKN